ncbi:MULTISPECIES: MFS transporter [Methylobacterium]|uniref:MFS transporter n=2 Tax=Methylobacterium TaxID=407 RepID=A0A0C6FNP8_9HYPH|nr:MFS transporter [Methylobacterium aquaticum]BAQ49978.1 MFS transporter [Methylobacterium aquaticum]
MHAGTPQAGTADTRKVALASFIGSTLEWYDFFIFGTAAALVFNTLFFPAADPTTGVIASFATFAVGFVARPIGGIVFGHYGDRLGRKAMLVLSLSMMGGVTFLIGLLPTYATLGVWAPVLLTALRFLQGFAVGGEWGGATLMVVEHAGPKRRGFYGSWPQMGIPAALLLSSGVMAAVTGLTSTEEFAAWGWRVPFLLSGVLLLVGIIIRRRLAESPSFQRLKQTGGREPLPIGTVLSRRKRLTALLIGSQAAENTSFYVFAVYSLAYLTTTLGVPRPVVLNALMVAAAACLVAQPLFGALSDRIGRKRVFAGGMVFIGLFIVPFFLLITSRDPVLITVAMVLGLVFGQATTQAVQPSLFAEQYEAAIRYSGVSVAYQFATVLWSGPTPILAAALWAWSGSWWPLAGYIVAAALVSVLCIRPLREAAGAALGAATAEAEESDGVALRGAVA